MDLNQIKTLAAYIGGIAAAIACFVLGAIHSEPGAFVIGAGFVAAVAVAIVSSLTGSPTGHLKLDLSEGDVGAKFARVPDNTWYLCGGILIVAFVVGGILLKVV